MVKNLKIGLLVLALIGLPVMNVYSAMSGDQAPDFTLTDSNGKTHTLSDYAGKYVVLEWLNHDCPFVKKHYDSGNMQALQRKFADQDVVWFSILSSAPGKQGHYEPDEINNLTSTKNASPTAVLMDPTGDVGRLYEAKTTPHMYIIDNAGKLIYQGAIDTTPGVDQNEIIESENYVDSTLSKALKGEKIEFLATKAYGCSVKY